MLVSHINKYDGCKKYTVYIVQYCSWNWCCALPTVLVCLGVELFQVFGMRSSLGCVPHHSSFRWEIEGASCTKKRATNLVHWQSTKIPVVYPECKGSKCPSFQTEHECGHEQSSKVCAPSNLGTALFIHLLFSYLHLFTTKFREFHHLSPIQEIWIGHFCKERQWLVHYWTSMHMVHCKEKPTYMQRFWCCMLSSHLVDKPLAKVSQLDIFKSFTLPLRVAITRNHAMFQAANEAMTPSAQSTDFKARKIKTK